MKTILVALDFSPVHDRLIREASSIARALDAEMVLIHVAAPDPDFIGYEPGPATVRTAVARQLRDEHRRLQQQEEDLKKNGLRARSLLIQGDIAQKVLAEAQSISAAVIIMGSHGHGALWHLLLGSTTEAVIRGATCPVMVVPSRA